MSIALRAATREDEAALASIYRDSVRQLAPALYTPQQVAAWSAAPDEDGWYDRFIATAHTLVATRDGRVIGFAGLQDDGRVASLYVAPDAGRQGVASTLLTALIERARQHRINRLRTEASFLSRAVFERFGFAVDEVEHLTIRGVAFDRFRMSRAVFDSDGSIDAGRDFTGNG